MQSWCLDQHPILVAFRKFSTSIPIESSKFYHLFLSPPFALTKEATKNPLAYFFYSLKDEPNHLIQWSDKNNVLYYDDHTFTALSGFKFQTLKELMACNCTTVDGMSFTMHETLTDIHEPVEPPELCLKILEIYRDPELSATFLEKDPKDRHFRELMNKIDTELILINEIRPDEIDKYMDLLHSRMDTVCTEVFKKPWVEMLPVAVLNNLNFLIFNLLASKMHFKLIMAYNEKYKEENIRAQVAMRKRGKVDCDSNLMKAAVNHMRGVLHMRNPADAIDAVVRFFDGVVAALPGVEIAADDILPAICLAMSEDLSLSSRVMSFFEYLAELWPSQGLDEKTSYVLTTCAVAASHLASGYGAAHETEKIQAESEREAVAAKTNETIDMLNDLLGMI